MKDRDQNGIIINMRNRYIVTAQKYIRNTLFYKDKHDMSGLAVHAEIHAGVLTGILSGVHAGVLAGYEIEESMRHHVAKKKCGKNDFNIS
jgi:hypothetical protein